MKSLILCLNYLFQLVRYGTREQLLCEFPRFTGGFGRIDPSGCMLCVLRHVQPV